MKQGACHVKHGACHVKHGTHHVKHGACHAKHGNYHVKHGACHVKHGTCHVKHNARHIQHGTRHVEHDAILKHNAESLVQYFRIKVGETVSVVQNRTTARWSNPRNHIQELGFSCCCWSNNSSACVRCNRE